MRVLFITALPLETNNSSQVRNIGLIKGLISNGNKVTIICPGAELATNKIYADSFPKELDEVQVMRLTKNNIITSYLSSENKNGIKTLIFKYLRRLYSRFSIFKAAGLLIDQISKLDLNYKNFDLVISSSDPKASHKMAERIKKKSNLKWVQYWGDPLLTDISDSSYLPDTFKKYIESKLMKYSDCIFYVSPFTCEEQKIIYHKYKDKIYHLPPPYVKERISESPSNSKFTLGYFGSYYSSVRNIIPFVESVKKNNNQNLIIAGNTDIEIEKYVSENIIIHQRISRERVEELEQQCDALVCILNLKGTQIPGKIYQYASTNKPIIIINDGDKKTQIKEYFNQFNRFIICDNDEISINQAIESLIKDKRDYQPCSEFSSEIVAEKLLQLINGK